MSHPQDGRKASPWGAWSTATALGTQRLFRVLTRVQPQLDNPSHTCSPITPIDTTPPPPPQALAPPPAWESSSTTTAGPSPTLAELRKQDPARPVGCAEKAGPQEAPVSPGDDSALKQRGGPQTRPPTPTTESKSPSGDSVMTPLPCSPQLSVLPKALVFVVWHPASQRTQTPGSRRSQTSRRAAGRTQGSPWT